MSRTMTALSLPLAACGASVAFAADTTKMVPAANPAGAMHGTSTHPVPKAEKTHHAATKAKPKAVVKAVK